MSRGFRSASRMKDARLGAALVGLLTVVAAITASVALGSSSRAAVKIVPPTVCGNDQVVKHTDPDGVLKTLPAGARANYNPWPYEVAATPWKTFKGVKGPWKIGFVNFPINNPWQVTLLSELKKQFALAKAKGLVTGSLQVYIQPSFATATPEQQAAAIQTMVSKGVNGIIVHPLNALAEAKAFDAAGKADVPIVLTGDVAYNSKYSVNVWGANVGPMIAGTIALAKQHGVIGNGKTVNVLRVRGTAGPAIEQQFQDAGTNDLSACQGIKVVGQVYGNWNAATAKTEVLKWISSHPGVKVDLVVQNGAMAAGIIQAFEQVGQPVPPMNMSGSSGGDYSWWLANKSKYYAVGGQYTGYQTAGATFRILLRILAGKGLKLRDISIPPQVVTSANVAQFCGGACAGKPVTWIGDTGRPVNTWGNDAFLNAYFVKPGTPGGS